MKTQALSILFTLALSVLLLLEGASRERSTRTMALAGTPQPADASVDSQPAARIYFHVLSWVTRVLPAEASGDAPSGPGRVARRLTANPYAVRLCALKQTLIHVETAAQP